MTYKGRAIIDLIHELDKMPERRLELDLSGLEMSAFTLDHNYEEFRVLILALVSPSGREMFSLRNQDKLHAIAMDIARRLHNFVAAAFSLFDHTRHLYNTLNIRSKPFPEYEHVKDQLTQAGVCQFIVGLRKYSQHYRLPSITIVTQESVEAGGFVRTVCLSKSELLGFSGWSAAAKRYLGSLPDHIDVLAEATAYHKEMLTFNEWFLRRERELHTKELDRFFEKQAQLLELEIADRVDHFVGGVSPLSKEDTFLNIFSSQDFAELEQMPPDSLERANKAIELLCKHFTISQELKDQIVTLFVGTARAATPP